MPSLDFDTPADLEYFIDRLLDRMQQRQMAPPPKQISFTEARKELGGISDDTLTRRLQDANIKTYRHGRGKGFDRIHLPKLR